MNQPVTDVPKLPTLRTGIIDSIDGLVPDDLIEDIFVSVHTPAAYKFMGKSQPDDPFGFWMAKIDGDILNSVVAFKQLWQIIDQNLTKGGYSIYHMIVNANNFGDCPTIHVDIPADNPDTAEDHYTVLYYANSEWDPNWAGETVFYNDDKNDIIKSVYPRPGRITVFDSHINHVSRTPTRMAAMVRYTIAIKVCPAHLSGSHSPPR